MLDAGGPRYGFGSRTAIAGQHHHGDAVIAKRVHRFAGRRLDGIRHGEQARWPAVYGDEYDSLPIAIVGFRLAT